MSLKTKIYAVHVNGLRYLQYATTSAGAKKAVIDMLKDGATADLATGLDLYDAGTRGIAIYGKPDDADAPPNLDLFKKETSENDR